MTCSEQSETDQLVEDTVPETSSMFTISRANEMSSGLDSAKSENEFYKIIFSMRLQKAMEIG